MKSSEIPTNKLNFVASIEWKKVQLFGKQTAPVNIPVVCFPFAYATNCC